MKKLILLAMMFWGVAYGQSTLYLRGDSVMIMKQGDNSELIILNGTRSVTNGLLQNIGNGRTRFVSLDSITTAPLASNGLTVSGDSVQLGQNTATDGKVATFTSNRVIFDKDFSFEIRSDTAANGRYGNFYWNTTTGSYGGAEYFIRAKNYTAVAHRTDSTTAFMDGALFYAQGTLMAASGYDYRPGINLQHHYISDMRSTTRYASIEVGGASHTEFWADGHTTLSAIGMKRVNVGAYGVPGQTLKVNGSGRFTDSLYLDKIPLTTSLTNQYVLLLGTADSVVRRIHPDSLGGGGGSSSNFANADLTATGNRSHNFSEQSLTIDSISIMLLKSYYADDNGYSGISLNGEEGASIFHTGDNNHSSVTAQANRVDIQAGTSSTHYAEISMQDSIIFRPALGYLVIDSITRVTDTTNHDLMAWNRLTKRWVVIPSDLIGGGGSGANTALSNLASVAINTTLLPGSNDGAGLGNASFSFSDLFLAEGAVINFDNGDLTITQTGDALALAGGGLTLPAGTSGARTFTIGSASMYSPGSGIFEAPEFWTIKATNARHLIGESSTTNLWGALAWDHTNNHLRLYHSTVGASDQIGIFGNGNVGIGVTAATGRLHLAAGTATASTGPLKFTSGTLTTAAEAGLNEYNGNFYATKVNDVRFGVGGSLHNNVTPDALTGTGEEDLMTYSLPAGTLSADGSYIEVRALFNFVTTGQTITLAFGGTDVVDFTATGIGNYYIEGTITRTGAATQMAYFKVVGDDNAVYITTPAETLSGAITLKGTGDGVGAGDITQYQLNVKYFPN